MSEIDAAAEAIKAILTPQEPENQDAAPEVEPDAVEVQDETPVAEASDEGEAEVEVEEGAVESSGTIEPPAFLTADQREAFVNAPPEIQQWTIQRHQDQESAFTKKSQEIAETRKAVEAKEAALEQQRQAYEQALASIPQENPPYSDEDLAKLAEEDEISWSVAKTRNAEFRERQENLKAQQRKLAEEAQKAAQAEHVKAIQEAAQRLPEVIPEWADEKVATEEKTKLAQFLSGVGYSDEVISAIADPNMIAIANDARKWRELQAGKVVKLQKVKGAPKMGAPGSPTGKVADDVLKKAQAKAKESGKVDDVGKLLELRFAKRS